MPLSSAGLDPRQRRILFRARRRGLREMDIALDELGRGAWRLVKRLLTPRDARKNEPERGDAFAPLLTAGKRGVKLAGRRTVTTGLG